MHSKHDSTQAASLADLPPLLVAELVELFTPAGTIRATIGVIADPGWLLIDGTVFVNAQTLAPTLWARMPAALKAGANILMPDARGCTLMMVTALVNLGTISGSNTKTLTQANLPNVGIGVDPPSTLVSVDPPSTLVSVNPPATAVSGRVGGGGQHNHYTLHDATGITWGFLVQDINGGPNAFDIAAGTGAVITTDFETGPAGYHDHDAGTLAVDIAAFNVAVDIAAFNVAVDLAPFTTAPIGSGTAHDVLNKNLGINWQIKAH